MKINEVNLDLLSKDEFFLLIKLILLSYKYTGFSFSFEQLTELEKIIYEKSQIHAIKLWYNTF